jgi:hypothetical protein
VKVVVVSSFGGGCVRKCAGSEVMDGVKDEEKDEEMKLLIRMRTNV